VPEAAHIPGNGSGRAERHLPVLAGPTALPDGRLPPELPVPAAVAVAGGGFLAGLATLTLLRLLRPRRRRRSRALSGRREGALEVAGTRSFIGR
jgi:hypothetical protein